MVNFGIYSSGGIMDAQPQIKSRGLLKQHPGISNSIGGTVTMPHSTPSAPCVKTCTKCGKTKPATTEYYSIRRRSHDGFQSLCKLCEKSYREANREQSAQWRDANAERLAVQKLAYRIANREKENARALAHYIANRESKLKYQRDYYLSNRESARAFQRVYRLLNREKFLDYYHAYYVNNRARMNAQARRWRRSHPETEKAYSHAKRARKKSARGTHTASDIRRQYAAQKGMCYYCQEKTDGKYHVEHVIPLSRGGSNGPENIVISCPKCNLEKGTKMPHEWSKGGRLL